MPEKTRKGAFSAHALPEFYGSLSEPIALVDVHRTGDSHFAVRYRFRNGKQTWDGSAAITTVKRGGRDFIQSIRAQNGCKISDHLCELECGTQNTTSWGLYSAKFFSPGSSCGIARRRSRTG